MSKVLEFPMAPNVMVTVEGVIILCLARKFLDIKDRSKTFGCSQQAHHRPPLCLSFTLLLG